MADFRAWSSSSGTVSRALSEINRGGGEWRRLFDVEGEHRMRRVFRQIRILVVAPVLAVAVAGLSVPVALAADADHGADLAKRWCAACHVVDRRSEAGKCRRAPVCGDRGQVEFHPGKGGLLPARPAPEDAEFSVEPERGGRSRRLYRRAAQKIRRPKMQIPAGCSRQGSAEKSTDGEFIDANSCKTISWHGIIDPRRAGGRRATIRICLSSRPLRRTSRRR